MYPRMPNDGRRCAFNLKNVFVSISVLQLFMSSIVFFLFEAEAIGDRADSFYMSISHFLSVWHAVTNIWMVPQIFQLFGKFEQFIDIRKFNSIA